MIAVVVPTNRPERIEAFKEAWQQEFYTSGSICLYVVYDGEKPYVEKTYTFNHEIKPETFTLEEVMGKDKDLIYNFNDGVRNLGFAKAYQDGAEYILSLDDDTLPCDHTIIEHLTILQTKQPISWVNTTNQNYMRGFPYGIREEAPVKISHGGWTGVADFDASTQLVLGTPEQEMKKMIVPKGALFPMCIMNVMFHRDATPYMYQAPMFGDINRFADIFAGIEAKKDMDRLGWAVATGYSIVRHERASDPFVNLIKEAKGLKMNEEYGQDPYFELFFDKRNRWQEFLKQYE